MKNNFKPTVYIICGIFNHLEDTKSLLNCIKKQSYPNVNTLIIDDGSVDGSDRFIQQKYPNVKLLKGDGNLWWTGAIKWAVEEVLKVSQKGDFILTINNDCIFSKNYIRTLLQSSIKFKRAIMGSLAVDKNDRNRIYDAGMKIDWEKGKFILLSPNYLSELPEDKLYQEDINILSTKGTLYPIEVFNKIGNFDQEHFPHYLSDYEFAYRAKENGFKLVLSYQAIVYNDIERTGLWNNERKKVSLKETWDLLFSRRSKINIIDNLKFIKYCCPKKYKFRNYVFLLRKIIISGCQLLFS